MVDQSRLVEVLPERVGSVSSPHFPHNMDDGQDYSWSLDSFKKSFQAKITRKSDWRIEFDLIGLDASIANAIRRVLLAEVPTVAIEQVFVFNNTSIIVDEVLSHRLGLVPIKVDPERIDDRPEGVTPTDRNTLVFKLDVECNRISNNPDLDESEQIENLKVLSSALEWDPKGTQAEDFADDPPKPVQSDILLAKLRPGQAIKMELHCIKGIGKDHAKFSPVSTASYRLLPHIDIPDPSAIEPEHIQKFVTCFPPGVIGVRKHKDTGRQEVFVKNPRKDTVSREVLRYKEFEGKVKLGRVRDHFLFDLESSGVIPPQNLMPAAIKVLKEKIRTVRSGVDQLEQQYAHIPQR